MSRVNALWSEKYRPKELNAYIFHDEGQKKRITSMVKSGEIPNLLLSGVRGTGKTTLSGVLLNELGIDPSDVLRVNASDETGVDTMREKIKNFAQSYAMGPFKVVQLEEMDYLTPNAQATLRSMMEDYSGNCRFICTCNYDNKVLPELKSRLQHFHYKAPSLDDVTIRAAEILAMEEVEFDIELLNTYVTAGYPDIRKIINLLQQNSVDGKLLPPNAESEVAEYKAKFIELLKVGNFREARKLLCDNVTNDEYVEVFTLLYNMVGTLTPDADKQDSILVTINEHLYQHALVAVPEINMAACIIAIGRDLKG